MEAVEKVFDNTENRRRLPGPFQIQKLPLRRTRDKSKRRIPQEFKDNRKNDQ